MKDYDDVTTDWKKYLDGVKYNNALTPNYYDSVDTNLDFFDGKQWKNVESNGMPTPVFNIIKRAITFFVASITSSKTKIKLEPLEYSEDEAQQTEQMVQQDEASKIATSEIDNLFEKFKMDNRIRDALFKAAKMGDVAAHLYFDKRKKPYGGAFADIEGEICFELVNGTNVFFGNANNCSTDKHIQPYIGISGRDMTKNLKAEAKAYNNEIDGIISDGKTENEAGSMSDIEIESDEYGKSLYVIVYSYDPDTDTIKVSKCTESAYMYKDIDTELSEYPVTLLAWEKQENQYHGRALCTDIIPNQIFINRMFAMVMYHLMMAAFPKTAYNADKIASISNMIAAQIAVKGMAPGENIANIIHQFEPGNMSAQIVQVIELVFQYTKEMLGINDSTLGNINPEQASGVAIASTVRQASIPTENTKANLYEWTEDIGRILVDMMGTYYGQRPIVIEEKGNRKSITYDFSIFKQMWLKVKCDVGPSTYWSEIAQVQMLDNLLNRNDPLFGMIDYVETLPANYANRELIERLKDNLNKDQTKQREYEIMAQIIEQFVPPEMQPQIMQMLQGEQQNIGNTNTLPQ